jgi:hypothetical protein
LGRTWEESVAEYIRESCQYVPEGNEKKDTKILSPDSRPPCLESKAGHHEYKVGLLTSQPRHEIIHTYHYHLLLLFHYPHTHTAWYDDG